MKIRISSDTFFVVHRKGFFFRLRGKGLAFEIDRGCYFSQRYGHRKVYRFGRLSLEVLR
ncbi:hypothetical protein I6G56_26640 [Burkholderia humptydooensis]|uniref:Uncharacterized protein n=2 Tax=Burkholderia humptydooensis TaxID=430531 RepID=A0A7T2U556_9BURK|nr:MULTISPECIES: hypothetical protein [Burkholderia]AJY40028.1 hypothetical protein BW21_4794 [Burkholderia sp. 2002721687]EIP85849.1 hypothetical protein A33K_16939 [Burkholderia humptydooensis MSMB43]QPS45723.1 hypothetical protein I6G56_26640 [Burkholderia humptydooensis]